MSEIYTFQGSMNLIKFAKIYRIFVRNCKELKKRWSLTKRNSLQDI
jgi:hypothetical protein